MADDNKKPTKDDPKKVEGAAPEVAPEISIETDAQQIARLQAELVALKARQASGIHDFLPTSSPNEAYAGEDEEGEKWYHYRIDLPASGGFEIKINGMAFYHGEQYKVTDKTLATLKDIVARSWGHEAQINGSNENAYRKPTNRTFSGGEHRR